MDLKEILPKDKGDVDSLSKLSNYSFIEVQPIVKDLLACLQDMNWPIASIVANYLRPHSNERTNEITEILRSNDDMWKYWIITVFFFKSKRYHETADNSGVN